jgi:hypothetical protein
MLEISGEQQYLVNVFHREHTHKMAVQNKHYYYYYYYYYYYALTLFSRVLILTLIILGIIINLLPL